MLYLKEKYDIFYFYSFHLMKKISASEFTPFRGSLWTKLNLKKKFGNFNEFNDYSMMIYILYDFNIIMYMYIILKVYGIFFSLF